jgi:threonine dehydratase
LKATTSDEGVLVTSPIPSLADIETTRIKIAPYIVSTPTQVWRGPEAERVLPPGTDVVLKLELFQITGSFKLRGVLGVLLEQSRKQLNRGIVTVSSGNHAIATAYAAQALGTTARIVMARSANPYRVAKARQFGALIEFADDATQAFERAQSISGDESRLFLHPFEGPLTARGTATSGLEFAETAPPIDAMILAIGGGGLCGGFASALYHLRPEVEIFGVEPEGADVMRRSFAAGGPVQLDRTQTIADSLAPPQTGPYAYALNRALLRDIVTVSDLQLCEAMRLLFDGMKLAVEPAGAAATAALLGPLRERLAGRRVGVMVCGSNISVTRFHVLCESAMAF